MTTDSHPPREEFTRGAGHRLLVQRDHHATLRVHALGHFQAQFAGG